MTVTLTPDTEARLRAVAEQRGLSPEVALDTVLAEAQTDFNEAAAAVGEALADLDAGDRGMPLDDYRLAEAERDFEESVEGIRRGMADARAGRESTLEEYRAGLRAEGQRTGCKTF